ncbi:hypothetical protein EWM64_g8453 [Hericium alpestre]|uniref:Uncharacterized protein n=1 Tax=Hericium alpestre TaxID=135208 RepID=A0A4Y9ZQ48_9AGAM|nr:hypothetical protein EWM64_g8453 [Hericium alpestre]
MPHLVKLALAGTPQQCAGIMRHLDIPASTQLDLDFSHDVNKTSRADVLPCVRAHARAMSCSIPLRTLWLSSVEGCFTLLRIWNHDLRDQRDFNYIERTLSPRVSIRLEVFSSHIIEATVLPDFTKTLAVSELDALRVDTWYATTSSQIWKDMLEDATQLRSVCICGPSATGFCEAITTPVNGNLDAFLPKLQVLELRNVHFGFGMLCSEDNLGDLLPQWIIQRQSQNPLSRLVITQCHIEEECVDLLKYLVELDWDGCYGEYDSDWLSELSDENGSETDWTEEDLELAQLVHDVLEGRPVPDD